MGGRLLAQTQLVERYDTSVFELSEPTDLDDDLGCLCLRHTTLRVSGNGRCDLEQLLGPCGPAL